jgi:phage shock protein PspC (stress-responsive transcriptional regulator)
MPVAEPHRLTRSNDGRIVAGVCAGAGRYFDIDPVIFRVVLAVLAVFGGAGLVIYAAAWLLIPETGAPQTRLERWLDSRSPGHRRDLIIVAAVLFVLAFVLRRNGFAFRISGAVFVIVVLMSAVALLDRRRGVRPSPPDGRPEGPTTYAGQTSAGQRSAGRQSAEYSGSGYSSAGYTSSQYAGPSRPTAEWNVPMPRRHPHSWLGWLIVAGVFLVAGGVSLVGLTGVAHPQPADVVAAVVAVVGVGLIVGAFRGRAWSMIPVGLLLVGLLGATDALPRNLTWSTGTRTWTPIAADLKSPYVLGAGDATLDLSKLGSGQSETVVSRIGAGRLIVIVPRGSAVSVDARMSAGRVLLFGRQESGTGIHDKSTAAGTSPAAGTLTLDLQVGYGDVEVRDAPA